jgi:hypothetical protein
LHTRFRKGQSGNPGGCSRKKLHALLADPLSEQVFGANAEFNQAPAKPAEPLRDGRLGPSGDTGCRPRRGALLAAGAEIAPRASRTPTLHFFELRLAELPQLKLDNREVIAARLTSPAELQSVELAARPPLISARSANRSDATEPA